MTPTLMPQPCALAAPLPAVPALPEQYVLGACLGEGGFGRVYEAWDSKLCRRVAVKCIRRADTPGVDLVREARLGASLHHAAFVKVHAIEDDGATQAIVMELVPGTTFKEVLAAGPVLRARALAWTRLIAAAMRDAHDCGLVHGDLKPSNVMIEPGGAVRILDFGLAHRLDVLATATMTPAALEGTIAYMAPERMLGAPLAAQADVYALGLILYELVCGSRPFSALNGLALAAAHLQNASDGWRYPADASPALVALIRAMTARQPQHRLASMAAVLEGLAGLETLAAPTPALILSHSVARAVARAVARSIAPVPALMRARISAGTRTRACAGAALACVVLGGALWLAAPYLAHIAPALTPFSESRALSAGLTALKLFDRADSLDSAERHFRSMLAHEPDSAAAAAGMALMYAQRYLSDRRDETWLQRAAASAQRATQLNDQLALGHAARGWVLEGQGKRDQALDHYATALRLDPGNFFAWHGQVVALRRLHRYPQARARLTQALARFPRERVFTDELGSVEFEQANYPAAEHMFRRSIALQPDASMAYANLNAALLRQNRDDEALQVIQQGLQIHPSANLYTNLGTALFLRQDYVGAAAAFEKSVSPTHGAPGQYQNWANLGDALNWIPGRETTARAAYDKARALLAPRLARAPDDVLLVSRMALYAARVQASAAALPLLRHALELAPSSPEVQLRAGLAYELLGKREAALAAINTACRLGLPVRFVEAEPDLVALRRDERYHPD